MIETSKNQQMENDDLLNQLPANERTLIEKYKPVLSDHDISRCVAHPKHDEVYGDPNEGIAMLAASMEEIGQGKPVIGWMIPDGWVEIIDGARIWAAANSLGWKGITVIILTTITEREVIPLMHALNSNQRKFSYRIAANVLASTKEEAKRTLKQAKLDGSPDADLTVRQYTAKVLGFENETDVSDFENIIKHPDAEIIIEQLDQGKLSIHKANCIARGTKETPKPAQKKKKGNIQVFTCPDCPRRAEFLKMLDEENDGVKEMPVAPTVEVEPIKPEASVIPNPVSSDNIIEKEAGND